MIYDHKVWAIKISFGLWEKKLIAQRATVEK